MSNESIKVLYISHAIEPFMPEKATSAISRALPQSVLESGNEIRVFMPKYGCINERRHQLHEVIRLSGMNLIINDQDHPLIIKVASIPTARMQVYFIDNEEYFQRKAVHHDEDDKFFADNDERALFFGRGVLETVRKLGWAPDVIHCHGWMTGFVPYYIRDKFHDDPHFERAKIIYSLYDEGLKEGLSKNIYQKLVDDGLKPEGLEMFKKAPRVRHMHELGMAHADGIVQCGTEHDAELLAAMSASGKPVMEHLGEELVADTYRDFYNEVLEEASVLVDS